MTIKPRRAQLLVRYNGKDISADLTPYLLDFSYTDSAPGEADDLTISLEDKSLRWINQWFPSHGDRIVAEIIPFDWDKIGDKQRLICGSFEVDSMEYQTPPDTISIKSTSVPVGKAGRLTKRSKAWEKIALKSIASEVAKACSLKLIYDSSINPTYDRQDQTDVTDLEFMSNLAKEEGLSVKVSADSLILFDEKDYEDKAPVFTIERGKSDLISFSASYDSSFVAYSSATISYTPPKPPAVKKANDKKKEDKKKGAGTSTGPKTPTVPAPKTNAMSSAATTPTPVEKDPPTIKVSYTAPGAPKGGPVLFLNESVSSEAEATRAARKALRENNKNAGKVSFELMGNVKVASGATFMVKGYGKFDGKYIVESAGHSVGNSGYRTTGEGRKVLGW